MRTAAARWVVLLVGAAVVSSANARSISSGLLFVEVAAAVGLDFLHRNGATGQYYMPELIGAGAALFDYDDDGDLDVFLLQGQPFGVEVAADREHTHRLFRNELIPTGQLRFTDVTARAGVGLAAYGMGAAVADYDNDGDVDLYVTAFGSNTLYRNNGNGTFTDVTAEAGVDDPRWSTSASFVDFDLDGHLDLFVANYLDFSIASQRECFDSTGARDYCGPRSFQPAPDRLFHNEGNGRFTDATERAGLTRADGNGLGVVAGDYNGDGWPDIYVANDATPNQLWINQHNGTFVDEGPLSGAAFNAAGNPEGSMGVASGDYDADGDEDLFVTNIIGETFVLYTNDGSAGFEDARVRAGVAQPTAGFTGFGTDWFDYDNDGWLDLFMANGAVNVLERLRGQPNPYHMKNLLFRNLGTGRLEDVSAQAGPAFELSEVSRAAAFGDVDNDGDTDIVVTTNNGPARLLRNQAGSDTPWLQVRLDAGAANRFGIGAWVALERAGGPTLWRRVKTDGSYLAASDSRIQLGLDGAPAPATLVVSWPGGETERWPIKEVNRLLTLRRGSGERLQTAKTAPQR
jgi:enediyne biosynthesis protein E4